MNEELSENGKPITYAIRRKSDGALLFDADGDGRDVAWEYDPDSATWHVSREQALHIAALNGLNSIDDAGKSDGLYEIISREEEWEEDIEDDAGPGVIPW